MSDRREIPGPVWWAIRAALQRGCPRELDFLVVSPEVKEATRFYAERSRRSAVAYALSDPPRAKGPA